MRVEGLAVGVRVVKEGNDVGAGDGSCGVGHIAEGSLGASE